MSESEQAARSRLQFLSQLGGATAGLSALAACRGTGLVDSGGSPIGSAAGRPGAIATATSLNDTPQFQRLMFKTDLRAVTRDGVAVIRDDLKSNVKFVEKINARLTLEQDQRKVSPQYIYTGCDSAGSGASCGGVGGGSGGGGSSSGGDGGGGGGGGGHHTYNGLPLVRTFNVNLGGGLYDRSCIYGENNDGGDTVWAGALYYPTFIPGPTYYTSPDPRPSCTSLEQPLINLANAIKQLCHNNPAVCYPVLAVIARSYGQYLTLQWAYKLVMYALAVLAEYELLPLVLAVGAVILLWWLVGCPH